MIRAARQQQNKATNKEKLPEQSGSFSFLFYDLAAGTATSVVVVAAAANEDNDEKDNPGAVVATEEVISTHVGCLLF